MVMEKTSAFIEAKRRGGGIAGDLKLSRSLTANIEDLARICIEMESWEEAEKWQEEVIRERDEQFSTHYNSKETLEHLERLCTIYEKRGEFLKRHDIMVRMLK